MPPWEAKKLLFSRAASQKGLNVKRKLLFVDATKAHVNGKCDVEAYIDLPEEIAEYGKCAKLLYWLYGMRPAARAWEDMYAEKLVGYGFVQGASAPTVFKHAEKSMECVVHGDDFTILGFENDLEELSKAMMGWFEIKIRGILGPDPNDMKFISILNRNVEWLEWGIKIEADDKHAEKIIEHFGLDETSRSAVSPGKKDDGESLQNGDDEDGVEGDEKLVGKEVSIYRGLSATANYLAQDRYDLQFGAKELCREMAVPTSKSMMKMKRAARYLVGVPKLTIEYIEQYPPNALSIYGPAWGHHDTPPPKSPLGLLANLVFGWRLRGSPPVARRSRASCLVVCHEMPPSP
jgi:hypothetical protein